MSLRPPQLCRSFNFFGEPAQEVTERYPCLARTVSSAPELTAPQRSYARQCRPAPSAESSKPRAPQGAVADRRRSTMRRVGRMNAPGLRGSRRPDPSRRATRGAPCLRARSSSGSERPRAWDSDRRTRGTNSVVPLEATANAAALALGSQLVTEPMVGVDRCNPPSRLSPTLENQPAVGQPRTHVVHLLPATVPRPAPRPRPTPARLRPRSARRWATS